MGFLAHAHALVFTHVVSLQSPTQVCEFGVQHFWLAPALNIGWSYFVCDSVQLRG